MTRDCEDAVNALRRTRRRNARLLWIVPVVAAVGVGSLGGLAGSARSAGAPGPSEGLVCDDGVVTPGTPNERVFTLTAKKGQIFTADGNQVPMWGFSSGNDAYQYPSPFLCAQEGDRITVVLHNRLGSAGATPIRTSIMFPGQADVTSDGVPVQPELVTPGDPTGGIASLVPSVGNGDSITYSFTAAHAGTYLYESGTSTAVQLQMGLFGGLIVRPPLGAGGEHLLYGGHPNTQYDPKREVVHLLSDVDPDLHIAVDKGRPHADRGLPPALLVHQRPRLPGHRRSELRGLAPEPAVRFEPPRAADLDASPPRRRGLAGRVRHCSPRRSATSTPPRPRIRSTRTPRTRWCTASTAARSSRRPAST